MKTLSVKLCFALVLLNVSINSPQESDNLFTITSINISKASARPNDVPSCGDGNEVVTEVIEVSGTKLMSRAQVIANLHIAGMTPTQAYNAANDGSMSLDELSDEEYNKLHDLYRENCLIDNETAFGNCMDSVPSSTLKDKELRDCVIENFPQEAIYDLLNSVASGGQEKNIEIYMGCAQLKLGVEENLKKDCRNDKGRKTKQCNAIGKTTFFH